MSLGWSRVAIERAVAVARFIAEDKPGDAERWLKGLFAAVDRLETFSSTGHDFPQPHTPERLATGVSGFKSDPMLVIPIVRLHASVADSRHPFVVLLVPDPQVTDGGLNRGMAGEPGCDVERDATVKHLGDEGMPEYLWRNAELEMETQSMEDLLDDSSGKRANVIHAYEELFEIDATTLAEAHVAP